METLRKIILECSPEITEKISWGMATFVLNGNLVHFSGEKKHMGFRPAPSAIQAFKDRLKDYVLNATNIHAKQIKRFSKGHSQESDIIKKYWRHILIVGMNSILLNRFTYMVDYIIHDHKYRFHFFTFFP